MVPVPIGKLAEVILGQAEPETLRGFELRGLGPLVQSLDGKGGVADETRAQARRLTATHLVVEETAQRALHVLQGAGCPPVLLKGLAVADLYPRADLRPTGDVDLLVQPEQFDGARSALEAAGWRSVASGPWAEDYLRREGYCWQAVRPGEAVLELHYRLWGSVATGYGGAVVESAVPIGDRQRPCPEDLVVIAASHAWRQSSPRRGADFIDVALVLSSRLELDYRRLLDRLELSGQHLPVALCLRSLGESLPEAAREWLSRALVPRLHDAERRLYRRTRARDPDLISWSSIRLAMLRSGRPARIGWWAVWRHIWPHPVVFDSTTAGTPVWLRQLLHLIRRWG